MRHESPSTRADFLTAHGLCYSLSYGQIRELFRPLPETNLDLQRIPSRFSEGLVCGPYRRKFAMSEIDHDFVEKILAGDRRAIARAISSVENRDPSAIPLLRACSPRRGGRGWWGLRARRGQGRARWWKNWRRSIAAAVDAWESLRSIPPVPILGAQSLVIGCACRAWP